MPEQVERRNGYEIHPVHCECPACESLWADWVEQVRARERLALLDAELRQASPATDDEWAAFFDTEFPRSQP